MTVSDKLPDWLVERAALGEIPAASRARLERAEPAELAARVAALHADDARELAQHPAAPAVAQIAERAAARRLRDARRRRSIYAGALACAGAAAVVIALGVGHHAAPDPAHEWSPPIEDIRVKGHARLAAFRQAGTRAEQLAPDALVHAGDVLQLRYTAAGRRYGVIASLDGAGVVTLHFPASESAPPEATALAAATTALPEAYALDDAPRFERFFFVTSNQPIDVGQSLAAIKALAAGSAADADLDLPWGQSQSSLRLRKP